MNRTTSRYSCQKELQNADLRVTEARLGVLAVLKQTEKPLAAQDVLTYLKRHSIRADKATVFRIINSFAEKGIVVPVQFNEGRLRFETTSKGDHHHFVCDNCGYIEDISDCSITPLADDIQKKKGVIIRRHSLEFFGICTGCQK